MAAGERCVAKLSSPLHGEEFHPRESHAATWAPLRPSHWRKWKAHGHARPALRRRCDRDLRPVHVRDPPCDREPEPGAHGCAARTLRAIEAVEHARNVGARDTNTAIL